MTFRPLNRNLRALMKLHDSIKTTCLQSFIFKLLRAKILRKHKLLIRGQTSFPKLRVFSPSKIEITIWPFEEVGLLKVSFTSLVMNRPETQIKIKKNQSMPRAIVKPKLKHSKWASPSTQDQCLVWLLISKIGSSMSSIRGNFRCKGLA